MQNAVRCEFSMLKGTAGGVLSKYIVVVALVFTCNPASLTAELIAVQAVAECLLLVWVVRVRLANRKKLSPDFNKTLKR